MGPTHSLQMVPVPFSFRKTPAHLAQWKWDDRNTADPSESRAVLDTSARARASSNADSDGDDDDGDDDDAREEEIDGPEDEAPEEEPRRRRQSKHMSKLHGRQESIGNPGRILSRQTSHVWWSAIAGVSRCSHSGHLGSEADVELEDEAVEALDVAPLPPTPRPPPMPPPLLPPATV